MLQRKITALEKLVGKLTGAVEKLTEAVATLNSIDERKRQTALANLKINPASPRYDDLMNRLAETGGATMTVAREMGIHRRVAQRIVERAKREDDPRYRTWIDKKNSAPDVRAETTVPDGSEEGEAANPPPASLDEQWNSLSEDLRAEVMDSAIAGALKSARARIAGDVVIEDDEKAYVAPSVIYRGGPGSFAPYDEPAPELTDTEVVWLDRTQRQFDQMFTVEQEKPVDLQAFTTQEVPMPAAKAQGDTFQSHGEVVTRIFEKPVRQPRKPNEARFGSVGYRIDNVFWNIETEKGTQKLRMVETRVLQILHEGSWVRGEYLRKAIGLVSIDSVKAAVDRINETVQWLGIKIDVRTDDVPSAEHWSYRAGKI